LSPSTLLNYKSKRRLRTSAAFVVHKRRTIDVG